MKKNLPEIIAHRGLSSLYPENTMAAFSAAAQLHVDCIEMDVQLTKDNVPVIIHDITLDRTTDGSGYVRDHTLHQIQSYSAGSWFNDQFHSEKIPTLEEVLRWAKNFSLKLNLELKAAAYERQLLWESVKIIIDQYDMRKQVIISSFDHVLMANIVKEGQLLNTAIIVTASLYQPLAYLQTVGTSGLHYYYPMMLENELRSLSQAGIKVRPYTINDEDKIRSAIAMGVHGIFTDVPHIALQIREEMFPTN